MGVNEQHHLLPCLPMYYYYQTSSECLSVFSLSIILQMVWLFIIYPVVLLAIFV